MEGREFVCVWIERFEFFYANYVYNYVLRLTNIDNKTTCSENFSNNKFYLRDICDKVDVINNKKDGHISRTALKKMI